MEKIAEANAKETTQIVSFTPYNVEVGVHSDSHCLNAAIAGTASYARTQTDAQIRHYYQQRQQILQQQAYVANRVQHVRAEVNARNAEIARFIRQNSVDPAAIDNHINIKLHAALDEAREATAASKQMLFQNQATSSQAMEDRLKWWKQHQPK
ncbi:hypothetical protein DVH05_026368 [Phytophthora capsici]|nr:hypothetical protein DVH05_026368 [Phytophthora capsici]